LFRKLRSITILIGYFAKALAYDRLTLSAFLSVHNNFCQLCWRQLCLRTKDALANDETLNKTQEPEKRVELPEMRYAIISVRIAGSKRVVSVVYGFEASPNSVRLSSEKSFSVL
jgi:hypothetical protein